MLLTQSSERLVRMLQPNRIANFEVSAHALFMHFFRCFFEAFSVHKHKSQKRLQVLDILRPKQRILPFFRPFQGLKNSKSKIRLLRLFKDTPVPCEWDFI